MMTPAKNKNYRSGLNLAMLIVVEVLRYYAPRLLYSKANTDVEFNVIFRIVRLIGGLELFFTATA